MPTVILHSAIMSVCLCLPLDMDARHLLAYLLFIACNSVRVNGKTLTYTLNDGYEIPAVALGTSLGHLADKDGQISDTDYLETWEGLQDAKEENLTRSIGVSNFNLTQMKRLWDHARIKPAVLQIEVNPTLTNDELINWCNEHKVIVMAYTPFGAILGRKSDAPPPRADHPVLVNLAKKYNKTVPQILLRYLLDRHLVAIPRSTNKERIKQNIDIMDFSLTPDELEELSRFNTNYRLRTPAKWYPHPHFPFEKKNLTAEQIEHIIANSKQD